MITLIGKRKGLRVAGEASFRSENSIKGYNFNGAQFRNDRIKLTLEINL